MLRNVHVLGATRQSRWIRLTVDPAAQQQNGDGEVRCGLRTASGYDFGLLTAFASIALLAQPMAPLPSTTTSQD
jgi:hypothetical protein